MCPRFHEGFSKLILCEKRYPPILLMNARSLLGKFDELRGMVSNFKPCCVAVTESWLSLDHPDNLFTINGYALFRADRENRKGGGASIIQSCAAYRIMSRNDRVFGHQSFNIEFADFFVFTSHLVFQGLSIKIL